MPQVLRSIFLAAGYLSKTWARESELRNLLGKSMSDKKVLAGCHRPEAKALKTELVKTFLEMEDLSEKIETKSLEADRKEEKVLRATVLWDILRGKENSERPGPLARLNYETKFTKELSHLVQKTVNLMEGQGVEGLTEEARKLLHRMLHLAIEVTHERHAKMHAEAPRYSFTVDASIYNRGSKGSVSDSSLPSSPPSLQTPASAEPSSVAIRRKVERAAVPASTSKSQPQASPPKAQPRPSSSFKTSPEKASSSSTREQPSSSQSKATSELKLPPSNGLQMFEVLSSTRPDKPSAFPNSKLDVLTSSRNRAGSVPKETKATLTPASTKPGSPYMILTSTAPIMKRSLEATDMHRTAGTESTPYTSGFKSQNPLKISTFLPQPVVTARNDRGGSPLITDTQFTFAAHPQDRVTPALQSTNLLQFSTLMPSGATSHAPRANTGAAASSSGNAMRASTEPHLSMAASSQVPTRATTAPFLSKPAAASTGPPMTTMISRASSSQVPSQGAREAITSRSTTPASRPIVASSAQAPIVASSAQAPIVASSAQAPIVASSSSAPAPTQKATARDARSTGALSALTTPAAARSTHAPTQVITGSREATTTRSTVAVPELTTPLSRPAVVSSTQAPTRRALALQSTEAATPASRPVVASSVPAPTQKATAREASAARSTALTTPAASSSTQAPTQGVTATIRRSIVAVPELTAPLSQPAVVSSTQAPIQRAQALQPREATTTPSIAGAPVLTSSRTPVASSIQAPAPAVQPREATDARSKTAAPSSQGKLPQTITAPQRTTSAASVPQIRTIGALPETQGSAFQTPGQISSQTPVRPVAKQSGKTGAGRLVFPALPNLGERVVHSSSTPVQTAAALRGRKPPEDQFEEIPQASSTPSSLVMTAPRLTPGPRLAERLLFQIEKATQPLETSAILDSGTRPPSSAGRPKVSFSDAASRTEARVQEDMPSTPRKAKQTLQSKQPTAPPKVVTPPPPSKPPSNPAVEIMQPPLVAQRLTRKSISVSQDFSIAKVASEARSGLPHQADSQILHPQIEASAEQQSQGGVDVTQEALHYLPLAAADVHQPEVLDAQEAGADSIFTDEQPISIGLLEPASTSCEGGPALLATEEAMPLLLDEQGFQAGPSAEPSVLTKVAEGDAPLLDQMGTNQIVRVSLETVEAPSWPPDDFAASETETKDTKHPLLSLVGSSASSEQPLAPESVPQQPLLRQQLQASQSPPESKASQPSTQTLKPSTERLELPPEHLKSSSSEASKPPLTFLKPSHGGLAPCNLSPVPLRPSVEPSRPSADGPLKPSDKETSPLKIQPAAAPSPEAAKPSHDGGSTSSITFSGPSRPCPEPQPSRPRREPYTGAAKPEPSKPPPSAEPSKSSESSRPSAEACSTPLDSLKTSHAPCKLSPEPPSRASVERLEPSADARLKSSADARLKPPADERLKPSLKPSADARLNSADERLKASADERLKASADERLKASADERLKASADERLKASADERLKPSADKPLKPLAEAEKEQLPLKDLSETFREAAKPSHASTIPPGPSSSSVEPLKPSADKEQLPLKELEPSPEPREPSLEAAKPSHGGHITSSTIPPGSSVEPLKPSAAEADKQQLPLGVLSEVLEPSAEPLKPSAEPPTSHGGLLTSSDEPSKPLLRPLPEPSKPSSEPPQLEKDHSEIVPSEPRPDPEDVSKHIEPFLEPSKPSSEVSEAPEVERQEVPHPLTLRRSSSSPALLEDTLSAQHLASEEAVTDHHHAYDEVESVEETESPAALLEESTTDMQMTQETSTSRATGSGSEEAQLCIPGTLLEQNTLADVVSLAAIQVLKHMFGQAETCFRHNISLASQARRVQGLDSKSEDVKKLFVPHRTPELSELPPEHPSPEAEHLVEEDFVEGHHEAPSSTEAASSICKPETSQESATEPEAARPTSTEAASSSCKPVESVIDATEPEATLETSTASAGTPETTQETNTASAGTQTDKPRKHAECQTKERQSSPDDWEPSEDRRRERIIADDAEDARAAVERRPSTADVEPARSRRDNRIIDNRRVERGRRFIQREEDWRQQVYTGPPVVRRRSRGGGTAYEDLVSDIDLIVELEPPSRSGTRSSASPPPATTLLQTRSTAQQRSDAPAAAVSDSESAPDAEAFSIDLTCTYEFDFSSF